jgi:radical SAM-linked protein
MKRGALRYTGNLDLYRIWERTARRADLALAYSQGFHPQPKMQLAAALPLGFSSRCELIDMRIDGELDLATIPARLQAAVPPGLEILTVEAIDEKSPPLQTQIVSAEYELTFGDPLDADRLAASVSAFLETESVPRERRGKPYDMRTLVEELKLMEPDDGGRLRLFVRLAARPGATGRPEELLDALGLAYEGTRVERTRFIFKDANTPAS